MRRQKARGYAAAILRVALQVYSFHATLESLLLVTPLDRLCQFDIVALSGQDTTVHI